MASLYILILMTPTAKLFLSLQQVPQPLLSLEKRHSTPHYAAGPLGNQGCRREGGRQRGGQKRSRGRDRESAISRKKLFLSHSPHLKHSSIFPPSLRKRLTFVWSLWEVGIRSRTMGLPTVRGWEEPSQISQPEDWLIRPLSLPSHRPHINTFAPIVPHPHAAGFALPNSQFCPRQFERKFLTDNLPQIDLSERPTAPHQLVGSWVWVLGPGSSWGGLFHTKALGCECTCRTAEVEEMVECSWGWWWVCMKKFLRTNLLEQPHLNNLPAYIVQIGHSFISLI